MADLIKMVLPAFLGRHLPLVIGILSVPLALAFDTDSYFYGMLPVMIGIGEGFGIAALPIAVAMVVEHGASGSTLASMSAEVLSYYFTAQETREEIPEENTLIR